VCSSDLWAFRFLFHLGERRLTRRSLIAPLAFVLGTVFASTHAPWQSWQLSSGLGGFVGDTVVVALIGILPTGPTAALQSLSVVFGAGLIASAGAALGVTAPEAWFITRWMARSLLQVTRQCLRGLNRLLRALVAKYRAWRARPRSERMAPAEPTGSWKQRMLASKRGRGEPPMSRAAAAGSDDSDEDGLDEQGQALNSAIRALTGIAGEPEAATPARRQKPVPAAPAADAAAVSGADPARSPVAQRPARPAKISRRAAREQQPMLFESLNEAEAYEAPPLALLEKPVPVVRPQTSGSALHENARMLETVLEDYGVRGEITAVKPGPVVTLYELEPAPGLKASRIIGLADDIARSMSALSARVSTVPGRSVIGIELPNAEREKVLLRESLESPSYGDSQIKLALALGKDISGQPVVANLAKMPHLLIAGTTGSGKSVAINTMILSLLYRLSPKQCRLIMIDPKMLELSVYDNIPHLLAPVVTDPKKAVVALKWVVAEMEERYRKMSKLGVRSIDGYNARVREALHKGEDFNRVVQTGFDQATGEPVYESESLIPEEMPYIVVIVDEMADLMMVAGKEIEACIQRLAQMARASGIHLIMATQRPSVDVITGTIKANFPTRISFQVTSKIDSRTILGEQGAEQLLGMGDMLYMAGGGRVTRVHGPFVSDQEVEEVVRQLKTLGAPEYLGAVTEGGDDETRALVDEKLGLASAGDSDDTLYDKAVSIVARDRKCSTSYIQRKLAIGYNKAARLVEQMESEGVVSPANAVGKRDIMIEER
jgi:S-DNA-T family DNA segregation ATPase FtsK/SpoIIIE